MTESDGRDQAEDPSLIRAEATSHLEPPPDPDTQEAEFHRFMAQTRLHLVDELLRAQEFGWSLVAAIERCNDKAEARAVLMDPPFSFAAIEAEHVLDRTLGQRTRRGVESLVEERDRLRTLLGDE
jgi:hypothetical protein